MSSYNHDTMAAQGASGYPIGNDLQHKFIVHSSGKRAVSSKKVRSTKQKKSKTSGARNNTIVEQHPTQQ